MNTDADKIFSKPLLKWKPLTETNGPDTPSPSEGVAVVKTDGNTNNSIADNAQHPALLGVSPVLIKLLWDIIVYLYSSVSVRIKRLGISARAFENAMHEGAEKGYIIQSDAGATVYLIPTKKTFESFNMPCPYERSVSIQHSYFVGLNSFLLGKNPRLKSVYCEYKLGDKGSTSDIVTVLHDGTREVWEVTLSTTNILSNAEKYKNTAFARIIFLCRDYKLREAVKAGLRESDLDPDLLVRIDYMHFSQLLQRQRKMSMY